jgi:hypothetical protein
MNTRETTVAAIGETMIVLQKIERFLAAVLMHMATPAEAGAKLEKALIRDKETLGRLLVHFGERVELPENFAAEFDALLRDRNTFVHNLFMEPWFDLNTPDGLARLDEFMRGLRNGARTATKVMMASLTAKETDAKRAPEAQAYIERVFRRIEETAHPDVQSRVTDQYIDKVREDAQANFTVGRREA